MARSNVIEIAGYINRKLRQRRSSVGFYIMTIAEVSILKTIYNGVRRNDFTRGLLIGAASIAVSNAISFSYLWPFYALIVSVLISMSGILYILNKKQIKEADELFDNIENEMRLED